MASAQATKGRVITWFKPKWRLWGRVDSKWEAT